MRRLPVVSRSQATTRQLPVKAAVFDLQLPEAVAADPAVLGVEDDAGDIAAFTSALPENNDTSIKEFF